MWKNIVCNFVYLKYLPVGSFISREFYQYVEMCLKKLLTSEGYLATGGLSLIFWGDRRNNGVSLKWYFR